MKPDSREVPAPIRGAAPPAPSPSARPVAEVPPPVTGTESEEMRLLPNDTAAQFRSRWDAIQSGFVDDPRHSVQQAGDLVEEALNQLTGVFAEKKKNLQRGEGIPTEELRQTLRHYRLLLNHLF